MIYWDSPRVGLYVGDAERQLEEFPSDCARCCVTSPPYYVKQNYGHDEQIGLEGSLDLYIQRLLRVFREVHRILTPDGTLWLNMGDGYNGTGGAGGDYNSGGLKEGQLKYPGRKVAGLKPKDLCGIPWRVAFALQQEGWYLRSDIIWHKPVAMPGSAKDRPQSNHEYVFLFSRSNKYYYNARALKEFMAQNNYGSGDVWRIPVQPLKGAHFATFPDALVEACLIAGSERDDIVFDPFVGSGTVCSVAQRLGRYSFGIDINPEYLDMARNRCEG